MFFDILFYNTHLKIECLVFESHNSGIKCKHTTKYEASLLT